MAESEGSGVLFALGGFALLSVGDAVIKTMAGEFTPTGVAAIRFTFGAIGLATLALAREGRGVLRPPSPWLQVARGLCLALASLCFFSAVFVMPLAEATALVFVAPILTALLSGPLLKERVRPATFIASAIAFAGVLVVLRPNVLAIGIAALLPVAAALFMALLVIANRATAGRGSVLAMQFYVAAVAAPVLIAAAAVGHASGIAALALEMPPASVALRCALVAITASTAHYLVYLGTTRANAASVAPMTYVQLIVATAIGWWWFGDRPDLATLGGAAIIVAAGLYLWRDTRRHLRAAAAPV